MIDKDPRDGFVEALLAATQPKAETFEVKIAPGFVLHFRAITDYTETLQLREKTQTFMGNLPALLKTKEWAPYAKMHPQALGLAFYMAETSAGDFRLDTLAFAKIAKERANVFDHIRDEINGGQYAIVEQAEDEAVTEAKNESSGTFDGETA